MRKNLEGRSLFTFVVIVATFLVAAFSSVSHAEQVWVDTAKWTNETELEYQKWVRDEFPADIFSRKDNPYVNTAGHPFNGIKENPYQGMNVDCADAVCIMRAMFAHAKGLPYVMHGNGVVTNRESYGGDAVKRFRSLMGRIIANCSTLTLENDTFLVAADKVAAGDVYRFNYVVDSIERGREGRHVHIVKDVAPTGNIKFIWASLPGFPRPLAEKDGSPELAPMTGKIGDLKSVVLGKLGFRRFFQPQDYALNPKDRLEAQKLRGRDDEGQSGILDQSVGKLKDRIASEAGDRAERAIRRDAEGRGYSEDILKKVIAQEKPRLTPFYHRVLAESLVSVEFADEMVKKLRTGAPETAAQRIPRMLSNICNYTKDRAQNIYEGLIYREERLMADGNVRCMGPELENFYSTPGRDKQMGRVFEELYVLWWRTMSTSEKAAIPAATQRLVHMIFPDVFEKDQGIKTPALNEELYKFCPVEYWTADYAASVFRKRSSPVGRPLDGTVPKRYAEVRKIDLRQTWVRILNKRLSHDPHDPLEQRWGEPDELYDRTKTKACVP